MSSWLCVTGGMWPNKLAKKTKTEIVEKKNK